MLYRRETKPVSSRVRWTLDRNFVSNFVTRRLNFVTNFVTQRVRHGNFVTNFVTASISALARRPIGIFARPAFATISANSCHVQHGKG